MIIEIMYTLLSIGAVFGGFYLLCIALWKHSERLDMEKACPHCKVNNNKSWVSSLLPS